MVVEQEEQLKRLASAVKGEALQPSQPLASREESVLGRLSKRVGEEQRSEIQERADVEAKRVSIAERKLTQKEQQTKNALQEKRLALKSYLQNQALGLLTSLEQKRSDLTLLRDRSKAEQASFIYRLSSEQYMQQLKQESAKSRLTSDIRFKEALNEAVWQDALMLQKKDQEGRESLFFSQIEINSLMKADERSFSKRLQDLSIKSAWDIWESTKDSLQQEHQAALSHAERLALSDITAAADSLATQIKAAGVAATASAVSTIISGAIEGKLNYDKQVTSNNKTFLSSQGYSNAVLSTMTIDEINATSETLRLSFGETKK